MVKNKYLFLLASITLIVLAFVVMVCAQPPVEKKIIHSTPPAEYAILENPFKAILGFKSPAAPQHAIYDTLQAQQYARIIEIGGGLYNTNCAPCHGDKSNGRGSQAAGFYPPPADFTNPETIAALKENYMFWRIKEGGIEEPFKSAMPAFGDIFTDEEIWSIITYEYYNAGVKPKQ